jgi:hypothetical protein
MRSARYKVNARLSRAVPVAGAQVRAVKTGHWEHTGAACGQGEGEGLPCGSTASHVSRK